jgi:hypothetical protein
VKVDSRDFTIDDSTLWETINSLPLSYQAFARRSHLYARAYGVVTTDRNSYADDNIAAVLNPCMRNGIYSGLVSAQSETEKRLGYKISRRYITETVTLRYFLEKRVTEFPGVEAMNIQRVWYGGSELLDVTPYVATDVDTSVATGVLKATVPAAVLRNPAKAQYRVIEADNTDAGALTLHATIKPKRIGDNWEITFAQHEDLDVTDTVNVINMEYCVIQTTIPTTADVDEANFVLTYPDTNQIIPTYKDAVVDVDTDTVTFYPYLYAMVDDAFFDDTIDLINGEFYKLMPYAELKWWVDETVLPTLYWYVDGIQKEVSDFTLSVNLVDSEYGVYHLKLDTDNVSVIPRLQDVVSMVQTVKLDLDTTFVKFHYVVSPQYLPKSFQLQIPTALDAIANKVAAELPVGECGDTRLEFAEFIKHAQSMYTDRYVNSYTGTEVEKVEFGKLHGQIVYEQYMKNALIYSRPIVVSH